MTTLCSANIILCKVDWLVFSTITEEQMGRLHTCAARLKLSVRQLCLAVCSFLAAAITGAGWPIDSADVEFSLLNYLAGVEKKVQLSGTERRSAA